MNYPTTSNTSIAHLSVGQSLWQYLPKGSAIITSGWEVIELKTYLHQADSLVPLVIKMTGNQFLKIEFSQLYEIKALTDAQIRLSSPISRLTQILRRANFALILLACRRKCPNVKSVNAG